MTEARELLEELCRGHNARGSDGPCDCNACRFLAQPMTTGLTEEERWYIGVVVSGCKLGTIPAYPTEIVLRLSRSLAESRAREGELVAALATLTDAVMQHLAGERLDNTCSCPLGDVLDELPEEAWTIWIQTPRARAALAQGKKE